MLPLHARSVHSPDPLSRRADRLVREALCRWVCAHIDFAHVANRALAAYEASDIRDYSDDLGDETFTVRDAGAPDGYYLCSREWCCCDPMREEAPYCRHSLAVCLLLGYRSHVARLRAEERAKAEAQAAKPGPLRVVGIVCKPNSIRESHRQLGEHLAACREKLQAVGGAQ